jgi:dipeptidyl aminopeptidase/acylaminoacyl peptidase
MKNVAYSDIYQFNFLSDISCSPDGAWATFTKSGASEEKNGYTSEIWLMNTATGEHKKLTAGGDERGAFWLDARTVAFSTGRGKDPEKKTSQWFRISVDGGEAEKFLEIDERITAIKPLDDGKYLVMSPQNCEGKPEEKPDQALEGRDLYVFDEIPFWYNGQGVRNKIRNTIMIYDGAGQKLKTITGQYMNAGAMQLSPGKKRVAFTGVEYTDRLPRESGLYIYDIASGETRTIVAPGEKSIGSVCFMGDDSLFFTGTTFEFSGRNPRYFMCNVADGVVSELPFCDASPYGSVGTDCTYGGGSAMKYFEGKLYFSQLKWSSAHLMRMDRPGRMETVCGKDGSIGCFDICGGKVFMTAMRGMSLMEIWSLDLATGEEKQLTRFNAEYLESHCVVTPEYFTFTNSSGYELEGFVMKPVGYVPGRKYPGILEMHGGPKAVFGGIFHHEMQCFANQGYFVFYTNPRGSDGRGEEFANITEKLGNIDYDDFMEFTDQVLRRYPDIDENKVGICGGSYGGFMCNWMIGHTDRFAAAASQRSISNYLTKALCTDIGFSHNMAQLGTDPWHDFDTVWEHSPLKCAPNAKTPTLFIQSDEDYRCWMSDAIQMFTALKMNGVDSRIALFHGENHELSRSGKPQNRVSRLTEIGNWFEKYLKQ